MAAQDKNDYRYQRGFVPIVAVVVLAIAAAGLAVTANIKTTKEFSRDGQARLPDGQVLSKGSDDSDGSSSGSGSSKSSESESRGSSSSTSGGSNDNKTEESKITTSTGTRIETKNTPTKSRTEVRLSENEKIKTRVENGKTRVDIRSGGVKVRYEIEDGQLIRKVEDESGEEENETELEENEQEELDDRLGEASFEVQTEDSKLKVHAGNVAALSNFPLSINLDTKELVASTSAGVKVIAVLPDKAIENMLETGIITGFSGGGATPTGNIPLTERNGVPVYEVEGVKAHNFLGLIPISTRVMAFVSAEDGTLVARQQSIFASIVDFLSP